jgi:hypothetical protein
MESQIYSPMMTTVPTTVKTNRVCGVILMILKVTCVLVLMGLMSFYIYGQVVVVPPPASSSNASNASTIAIPARFQIMIQKLVDAKLANITGHHRHASHDTTTPTTSTTTVSTTTTVNATSDYDYDAVHRLPDTLANASGDDYDANTLHDGA